jgi:hypothetical protein
MLMESVYFPSIVTFLIEMSETAATLRSSLLKQIQVFVKSLRPLDMFEESSEMLVLMSKVNVLIGLEIRLRF